MDQASRSGHLEDNRFRDVPLLTKKQVPYDLHWFLDEDYFTDELVGFHESEVQEFCRLSKDAFELFEKATHKILADRQLSQLGIPSFFEDCIYYSWENRYKHPFLTGRFDINGGFNRTRGLVIEFNADTYSTLPETLYWQVMQLAQLPGQPRQFNQLQQDLISSFQTIGKQVKTLKPVILGSSFGYPEDVHNVSSILSLAEKAGYTTYYQNLEHVVFSEEGIFYHVDDDYVKADVWYKIIPWDWMFTDEPELAKILSAIIQQDLAIVLNPPYTSIWQNKLFLAYITRHFPNFIVAETFQERSRNMDSFVRKPVYGRMGENILLKDENGKEFSSKGDFGKQTMVYQKYQPLIQDLEKYYYQTGVFYTHQPSAINVRAQNHKILTNNCEFLSHFIL
jgi:glutathionylspermidine synthase